MLKERRSTTTSKDEKNKTAIMPGGSKKVKKTAKASGDNTVVAPLIRRLPRTVLEQLVIGMYIS